MSDSNIYKMAFQQELRFQSKRGLLTVENLFQMPLQSTRGFDLDTVARTINKELKEMADESFVETKTANPRKAQLELSLAIVKDVIATKQEENAAALAMRNAAAQREKLLDLITNKKDAALAAEPVEELEKKLAALGGIKQA